MTRDGAAVPIVGRAEQLEVLLDAFREVEQGDTAAVFVTGDSGVGKTRLISAASELLLYLLANLEGIRLLLLGAVRAEVLHGTDPLRRMLLELRRLRSVRVLELQPLDREQTDALAAAIVGRPLPVDEAELVWERSR